MFSFLSKWPSVCQWRQFFKVLSRKEKSIFFVLLGFAVLSLLTLFFNFYFDHTYIAPKEGGTYVEGVVGSPRYINPAYAASDVDRDLIELIFAGLMKFDENGKIVPDLAREYAISEDGKTYEFYLKENLLWHDLKPLTADDVVFTIKTIQDNALKSPLQPTWWGVKVEKISDLGIRFELKNPSAVFLENCTLKIMPKHIWQDVSSENFPLTDYNFKPVGSGPYKLAGDIKKDKDGNVESLELTANKNYSGGKPNIEKIAFRFFKDKDELISALNSKKIDGFSVSAPIENQKIKNKGAKEYPVSLTRYFAVFFNPEKAKPMSEQKVREALSYGTDKKAVVDNILLSQGKTVDSPILPDIYGFNYPEKTYQLDREKAKQLLEEAGYAENENGVRGKTIKREPAFQFKSSLKTGAQGTEVKELQKCLAKDAEVYPEQEITGVFGEKTKLAVIKFQEKYRDDILTPQGLTTGTGDVLKSTRDKLNALCTPPAEENLLLSFSISTVDQSALKEAALLLKEQWKLLGIDVTVKTFDISEIQEIIKSRDYELLLFGELLNSVPDLFPQWHSSQIKSPGFNLSGYENKDADALLESIRQSSDEEERKTNLEKLQNIIVADAPAIFLYSQNYIYFISDKINGVNIKVINDTSKRFSNVQNWYIETQRKWK